MYVEGFAMRGEWISHISVFIFAVATYIFTLILPSPLSVGGGDVGSYFFPKVIIFVILTLNSLSLIGLIKKGKKVVCNSSVKQPPNKKGYYKVAVLISLMVVYIAMLPLVGYVVSTLFLLVLMMLIYNVVSYKLFVFIPIGVVSILFFVFESFLRIPLP